MKTVHVVLLFLVLSSACLPSARAQRDWNGVLLKLIEEGMRSGYITLGSVTEGVKWVSGILKATFKSNDIPSEDEIKGEIERMLSHASSGATNYPLVIHANNLIDVANGWNVTADTSNKSFEQAVTEFREFRGNTVCLSGYHDTGKTFVINGNEGTNLPSGFGNVTSAFSFFRSILNPNVMYLDPAGLERTVSSDGLNNPNVSMEDRQATDEFIVKIQNYVCDATIYVAGSMQRSMVYEINNLFETRKLHHPKAPFILVHNYYNMYRVEDVERHITSDIIGGFKAVERNESKGIWRSHEGKMLHLVLGREWAPSGKHFNNHTFEILRNVVRGFVMETDGQDVISRMLETTQEILSEYFWAPGANTSQIPFVFAPSGISIDPQGASMISIDSEPQKQSLIELIKVGEYVRAAACIFWHDLCTQRATRTTTGMQQQHDVEETILPVNYEVHHENFENPFAVVFNATEGLIRLKNTSVELKYLPFTMNRRKFTWMPHYDLFQVITKTSFEWMLAVDVPGVEDKGLVVFCPTKFGMVDNTEIRITGMRAPPTYSISDQEDTPFSRNYGSFFIHISLPKVLSCSTLREKGYKLEKGVLYLSSDARLFEQRFSRDTEKK